MEQPVWESKTDSLSIATDFPCEPICNFGKLRFANSVAVFDVRGHFFNAHSSFVVWTVSAHLDPMAIPHSYTIKYELYAHDGTDRKCEGKLTEAQVACVPWYVGPVGCHSTLTLTLTAIDMVGPNGESSFFPLMPGLKSYVERGPIVTLIGTNGKAVTVPRRILKLRSPELEAMFGSNNFKEKQTNQIEMADF